MRRLAYLAGVATAAMLTIGSAQAVILDDDPLHGFCVSGATLCSDNGTITSVFGGVGFTGQHFGFDISPAPQTGTFSVYIGLPNDAAIPASVPIFGTISGNGVSANAMPVGNWTSGFLDVFLGFNATPNNPIDNFLPYTHQSDPAATGYRLFGANFGTQTLGGPNDAATPAGALALMNLNATLPDGSMIFGFLTTADGIVATASSGVLWVDGETPPPPPPTDTPEPATLAMLGAGLLALGITRRRHSNT